MSVQKHTVNDEARNKILEFEKVLKSNPDAVAGDSDMCPLQHSFSEGIYVRQIFIPGGTVLTGKIHKHSHPNFLMVGEVEVFTEYGGIERITGPCAMISEAGTKRVVKTIEDTIWITVHANPTNTQDLKELEKLIIAENYTDYERLKNKTRAIDKAKEYFSIIIRSITQIFRTNKMETL